MKIVSTDVVMIPSSHSILTKRASLKLEVSKLPLMSDLELIKLFCASDLSHKVNEETIGVSKLNFGYTT